MTRSEQQRVENLEFEELVREAEAVPFEDDRVPANGLSSSREDVVRSREVWDRENGLDPRGPDY